MSDVPQHIQVLVIGGGPAGSTAARCWPGTGSASLCWNARSSRATTSGSRSRRACRHCVCPVRPAAGFTVKRGAAFHGYSTCSAVRARASTATSATPPSPNYAIPLRWLRGSPMPTQARNSCLPSLRSSAVRGLLSGESPTCATRGVSSRLTAIPGACPVASAVVLRRPGDEASETRGVRVPSMTPNRRTIRGRPVPV